jgi:peroxiredoxin Q/BCP
MAKAAKKVESNGFNIGDKAPVFSMNTDAGGKVSLKDFLGKKNVVLYFYPKDDTPGCTLEAKDFSELAAGFKKADTVIIGVSKDTVKSHDTFKSKYCLPFTLGSDGDGSVCEAYGVWVEKSMYGKKYMGIQRATFLIDKKGIIAGVWPKVSVTGHAAEVLKVAQSL